MMNSKHIVHIVESFGGGIVEFIANLVNGLPQHKHTIIHGVREISIEVIKERFTENVDFYKWNFAQRNISVSGDLRAFFELRKIIKQLPSYDIIHLHSSKAGFIGRLLFAFSDTRVLYTPNGASFAQYNNKSIKYFLFAFIEIVADKLGGVVIGTSKSEAKLFEDIGVKCNYINNGIFLKTTNDKSTEKQNQKIVIINVGRITKQKNPVLFNNIALHFVDNPNIKFLWVGDGELRNELKASNVEITGWLPKAKVLSIMNESDIYLSTSLWEGLSFAVIEAMALNLPLLLSNCVGNKDMVFDKKNGYLFEDYKGAVDSIQIYINSLLLMKQHGENSRKIFEKYFTAELMNSQYNLIYTKR